MYPRYFTARYFAPRYFPVMGAGFLLRVTFSTSTSLLAQLAPAAAGLEVTFSTSTQLRATLATAPGIKPFLIIGH